MKKMVCVLCALCISVFLAADQRGNDTPGNDIPGNNILYQSTPATELLARQYDGHVTMAQLLRHGTLGVGTFRGYDGEMIVLGGTVYRVRAEDGRVYPVPMDETTPYALITGFRPDRRETVVRNMDTGMDTGMDTSMDFTGLKRYLDNLAPGQNRFYAFRIRGRFRTLKVRSLYRQQKPYPELRQVLARQAYFHYKDIEGDLVGFRLPLYTECLSTEGYHFHFISADKTVGGHVVDFSAPTPALTVEIDGLTDFRLHVPDPRPQKQQEKTKKSENKRN